jgi:hypothetical protein
MLRVALGHAVEYMFAEVGVHDGDLTWRGELSIKKVAKKYACSGQNGKGEPTYFSTALNTYWNDLNKMVDSAVFVDADRTKAVYLEKLALLELREMGNKEWAIESGFTHDELDAMCALAMVFGRKGFPLGHFELQCLAHNVKRRLLTAQVASGQREGFNDWPENTPGKERGDLPVCGEKWFLMFRSKYKDQLGFFKSSLIRSSARTKQ